VSRTLRATAVQERGLEAAKPARTVRDDTAPQRTRDRSALIVVGLVALLTVPLIVALVGLRQPRWYPIWDLALTEMQLRDVGTIHTTLTGVGSRVGVGADLGSHPGPLGFYMMFPAYRLFGATSWAMQVAAVSVHVAAIGTILWMVWRRRSMALLIATAALLAFLIRGLGPEALTQSWNSYLAMLWWVAFLVAVWLVVCGDVRMLPVAIFAGTFCIHNTASYVLLVTGLTMVAIAGVWVPAYRRRRDRQTLNSAIKWSLVAAGVGVAVWLPPLLDQLIGEGNLGVLWRHFRDWDEDPIGLRGAFDVLLLHLNPWTLLSDGIFSNVFITTLRESKLPGALLLTAWGAAAVIAVRLRHAALVRLHAVLAVTLILAVVTISRLGNVFWYLLLWLWGTQALLLLAVGWTLAVLVLRRLDVAHRARATKWLSLTAVGAAIALVSLFAVEAVDVQYDRRDSTVLGALVPQTAAALERDRDDRYFVQWDHGTTGAVGRGLMNELDRRGFDVNAAALYRTEVRPHRVIKPADADAVVVVAGGPDVRTWRNRPGVRQIAYVDLTGAQQAELPDRYGTAVFVAPSPRR
jgi:hypothetical protein